MSVAPASTVEYTRAMRRHASLLLLAGAAALSAEGDPSGTVALDLQAGQTVPVTAAPGASVLCDDLRVATGEFTADGSGFVIRAVHPGTTLCGVWLAGQHPGGLYRVRVREDGQADAGETAGRERTGAPDARAPDAGAGDAGAADAGAPDAGPG